MVVTSSNLQQIVVIQGIQIGFTWQVTSQPTDRVFNTTFLPRCMRITEEGFDVQWLVKSIVISKLSAVIKRDGAPQAQG
jgi:inner membrane protein involved in colicin E2 resistance